jgi:hypothetical protein
MEPGCYRISFDGMTTESGHDETALVGRVRDQADLYGILDRLRDFGLELLRVEEGDQ